MNLNFLLRTSTSILHQYLKKQYSWAHYIRNCNSQMGPLYFITENKETRCFTPIRYYSMGWMVWCLLYKMPVWPHSTDMRQSAIVRWQLVLLQYSFCQYTYTSVPNVYAVHTYTHTPTRWQGLQKKYSVQLLIRYFQRVIIYLCLSVCFVCYTAIFMQHIRNKIC